ncbi:CinA family protein [Cellulomonas sp. S1-8]|uniref:CinA family protein n=1 Tax=Cellulomonas sp. S1-8 TaxID=2904790 RepID=UPI002244192F|nr:CinA family protein [Cellulomonas sp. S1-8]UZN04894.1 CinA family protein [Cellulomonas sp. S1-8]
MNPSRGDAAALLDTLRRRGWTLAVAESLTGGLVTATLVDVPGASDVLRGGVVPYATDLKATLLGVEADLLAQRGAVDPDVALAMADGVRRRLGADLGLATTGVAGPDPQDGRAPGTVHVAVSTGTVREVRSLELAGDRAAVRAAACAAVLALAADVLDRADGARPGTRGTGAALGGV